MFFKKSNFSKKIKLERTERKNQKGSSVLLEDSLIGQLATI